MLSDLKYIRILIVEDSAEDRELYKRRMKMRNDLFFEVTEATTIEEGLAAYRNWQFDCCLVDYHLPDGSGTDFIKTILSDDRVDILTPMAIIMVTGQGSEELAVEAMKLGIDDYITKKSISEGMLVQPLLNAIERAQLTSCLQFYQDELKRSNAELSDFAHTASHDLKSPLRRIQMYCDMLKDEATDRLNDNERQAIDRMRLNARRMQDLIDNLLTYSLVRSEKEEKAMTDTSRIVKDILKEIEPLTEELHAQITCENLPQVYGYPFRLQQLFSNLISNALKYRKPDTAPQITIRCDERYNEYVFKVTDNGIGVPPEFRSEIFRDFKRLHSQEQIEGTGLGLSIVKKIVEKHDGRIWLESEEGRGSSFIFTLHKTGVEEN